MSSSSETLSKESLTENQPAPVVSPMKEEEDENDPQVEFCNLSSRSLQRPSDHYIPPPRRTHIASRLLRDPWTTALTQFSKVTNYVLNPYEDYDGPSLFDLRNTLRDPLGYGRQREEGANYGNRRDSTSEPITHPPPALPTIECSVPQQRLPPLNTAEYLTKYSEKNRRELLERVFKGGISNHALRRKLWPVILGITESHNLDWKDLNSLYTYFANQWKAILPNQESRFTAYRERKSLIDRDVVRCDRTHPFFSDDNYVNVEKLRALLMTYIMYDFDTGYVQGMTDLAAPLLFVWDGDIPKAFWCFVQIMNLFKRNFEMSQKAISTQLKALLKLVRVTDPVFAQYLCNNESENCYFAFRWIICLFKREFMKRKTDDYDDCLIVWETIWSIQSLASYDEEKQEKFLDQSLSPIFKQIGSIKRNLWSDEANEEISNNIFDTTHRGSSNSSNGIIELPDASTPSESNFPILIPTPIDPNLPIVPRNDPQQEMKLISEYQHDIIEVATPDDSQNTSSPIAVPPDPPTRPLPIKPYRIKLKTPPKPRPVHSSSPRSPRPGAISHFALSPPVREMYANMLDNREFMCGSFDSRDSKGSSEEIKRSPISIGKEVIENKNLDSSDELKNYEFDHLTDSSGSKLPKLENFELFCLCICLAIMRRERDIILFRKYEASDILKHFNTLQLNDCLNSILLHSMTIWHWLKHDGGEKSLYNDEDKPGNTSVDDFDLLNDDDEVDCQNFAALAV